MLIELHAHTSNHSSCSSIDPVTLVHQAVMKGLQGLIITDHHYLWTAEELLQLRKQAELSDSFILLSGQEIGTEIGHVLVLGANESIPKETPLRRLRTMVPSGALIWAHPFRNGKSRKENELLNPLLDAIEIFSTNHSQKENYTGLQLWHKHKFTATSGSDTHDIERSALLPTQFDHPVSSITDIVREIKASRCRPFFKEIPKSGSNLTVTEITFGTKGEDESRNRLILKEFRGKKGWGKEKTSVQIAQALRDSGFNDSSVLRVPKIINVSPKDYLIIEEGQRGKNLFELLTTVRGDIGKQYYQFAAQWLATMHNLSLRLGTIEDTVRREEKRLLSYQNNFINTHNPYLKRALALIKRVRENVNMLFTKHRDAFVQIHGDFHPKNIIIGYDKTHDPSTRYISVIDFNSSMVFHPAFDLGYFLVQFDYQMSKFPAIAKLYSEKLFIQTYLEHSTLRHDNLSALVKTFKLRAKLSIANYLIKVGKGDSREVKILVGT